MRDLSGQRAGHDGAALQAHVSAWEDGGGCAWHVVGWVCFRVQDKQPGSTICVSCLEGQLWRSVWQ